MTADEIALAPPPRATVDDLARHYHCATERFDRTLPHARFEGAAFPLTPEARAASNRFAADLRRRLSAGLEPSDWMHASRRYLGSGQCDRDMRELSWLPDCTVTNHDAES